jgi:uncharacterized protein YndB with AHSA1/START domain
MTKRSMIHGSFHLERSFPATPARVFKAFADPAAKALWFAGPPGWVSTGQSMDFRVGGRETSGGGPPGGTTYTFNCLYWDIIPDQRIVYSYEMLMGETRISVSLATLEFRPDRDGAKLVLHEDGAFLDGHDTVDQRREGTEQLLDALGASLGQAV